jgi:hypothetical protein
MDFLSFRLMHAFALNGSHTARNHRGVDLVSDVLPFGRLWYGEPNAIRPVPFGMSHANAARH